jgi:putative phosphonate metabolism protein
MTYRRYAVYYTPPPGPLADFGAAWLGWDIASGRAVPHAPAGYADLPRLTETPRRYGFHATIKPPFTLAPGTDVEALTDAVAALAASLPPARADGLRLSRIGPFLALVPAGDSAQIDALAAAFVTGLDGFRAPQSETDLARRRAAGLSPAQEAHLIRWGYPYVLDEFRFHMTLSGSLSDTEAEGMERVLAPLLPDLLPRPFGIGDMTLAGEDAEGRFHELSRHRLAG